MKYLLLFSTVLCLSLKSESQALKYPQEDLIKWNEFYRLAWDDFKGEPAAGAIGDAGTAVFIQVKPYQVGKNVEYDINVFFNKKKSWVTDKSQALLEHERLHFDLAEVYARKIRKSLDRFGELKVKDVKKYNAVVDRLLEESNKADRLYDTETYHGLDTEQQARWQQKIGKLLQDLAEYRGKKKVIKL